MWLVEKAWQNHVVGRKTNYGDLYLIDQHKLDQQAHSEHIWSGQARMWVWSIIVGVVSQMWVWLVIVGMPAQTACWKGNPITEPPTLRIHP